MNKRFLLSLIAAGLMGSFSSFAAVEYYVSTSGDDSNPGTKDQPFGSVEQAALSVLPNTETIIYLEKDATFKIGEIDFQENKTVSIIGDNTTLLGADKPGYEGGEANRILRAHKGCKVTLKGLTFKNSRQIEYLLGGAIFFAGESLDVDNCRFIDNECGSAGGAIGSRGNHVKVTNSYFEGNYTIGGGARGAAIMHCGLADGTGGDLYVENCTFFENKLKEGGQGTAIAVYDPSQNGGTYTTLKRAEIRNCTFVGNTSKDGYQAAVDISDASECETYLVNNTFYKQDGALRLYFQTVPCYMFNNFVYADKATVLSELKIADSDRTAITAYNNILVGGERGVNEGIDDPCLTSEAASCSNTIAKTTDYTMANLGVATSLKSDEKSKVPYLPIINANSPLVDAGLDNSSEFTTENVIPALDVCGLGVNGKKDIGAFEYDGRQGGVANVFETSGDVVFANVGTGVLVKSSKGSVLTVEVYTIDGKMAYRTVGNDVVLPKNELPEGLVIVKACSENETSVRKMIL